MKARDADRLATLRLLSAAMKQREVDERITLDDAAIVAVIDKMLKQRRDSVSQYEQAGRQDLAEAEKREMAILQAYLPQRLSEEEMATLVAGAIAEAGAATPADMGRVMAIVKPRAAGRADMGRLSALVKQALAG
jgi:uncharacterized protein